MDTERQYTEPDTDATDETEENLQTTEPFSSVHVVVDMQAETRRFFLIRKDEGTPTGNPLLDLLTPMNLLVHQEMELKDSDIWCGKIMISRLLSYQNEDENIPLDQFAVLYMSHAMDHDSVLSAAQHNGYSMQAVLPGLYKDSEEKKPALRIAVTDQLDPSIVTEFADRCGAGEGFAIEPLDVFQDEDF